MKTVLHKKGLVEVHFPVSDLKDGAGLRADAFLAKRLKRYSRSEVQRLMAAGRVRLKRGEGSPGPVKASQRLALSDTVIVAYTRTEEPPCAHERLAVLHEDDDLLAVDKPARVLSHPTDRVVRNAATSILARQFPGFKLHLAHRLDRETSGVLLLAKNKEAARRLTESFTRGKVRKEYLAVVRGEVAFERTVVDKPMEHDGGEIKVRQGLGGDRAARTEFERVAVAHGLSLVRALPRTGRLHQIRVHLASLGHPVLGDKLYQGEGEYYMKAVRRELDEEDLLALGASRQMLHAARLGFPHPSTGAWTEVEAPLPEDFLRLKVLLGLGPSVPGTAG
ncbi:MAG: RluA family pseudouridine synthase [Elusimicrobiota bacterium]